MIYSLIICSRKPFVSKELQENIKQSISENYELVIIDNSQGNYSICEAYNLGMDRSIGDYLVFLHDDILFRTSGWGRIIRKIFENNEDLGLLGIAGSTIKTKMPSSWWSGAGVEYIRIIQHDETYEIMLDKNKGFDTNSLKEVAVIDGVLMIMKKDANIRFDENLKGFHNYDLSISLLNRCLGKIVGVTNEILIEHFSGGKIDKDWYLSTSDFHKRNYDKLPIINSKISGDKLKNIEFTCGAKFVMGLLDYELNKEAFYWWIKLFQIKSTAKFHLKFILRFLKSTLR